LFLPVQDWYRLGHLNPEFLWSCCLSLDIDDVNFEALDLSISHKRVVGISFDIMLLDILKPKTPSAAPHTPLSPQSVATLGVTTALIVTMALVPTVIARRTCVRGKIVIPGLSMGRNIANSHPIVHNAHNVLESRKPARSSASNISVGKGALQARSKQ
jgi:hypothetical protein